MSAVVPPPPSGSILQKQSSFSRPKITSAAVPASGAEPPGAGSAPATNGSAATANAVAQRPAVTPQRPKPVACTPAVSPAQPAGDPQTVPPAPLGMWGPNNQLVPSAPAMPSTVNAYVHPQSDLVRQNSMSGKLHSSVGAGQMSGYGSMGASQMNGSVYGAMGPSYGSIAGGQDTNYGSMKMSMEGGDSKYSFMGGQGANSYGSMGGRGDMGSMYGMDRSSSIRGGSTLMPTSSIYGMGGPMGSLYGMGGMSAVGIAAQWGSLANMSMGGYGSQANRSNITSGYEGFVSEATRISLDELCPNIGTFEDAKDLPRSGKRGGNHLYSRGKYEKPTATGNSNAKAMIIRRKPVLNTGGVVAGARNGKTSHSTGTTGCGASRASPSTAASGKARAKVPSNYNVHSLILVEKATDAHFITIKDPSTVVFEKGGKKETFEEDEALVFTAAKDDIDSVLLSELRGNWFNGHNSALILSAGKGMVEATQHVARQFVRNCLERLERNEIETSVKFDVTMTIVSLRGADQCCDLLKSGASHEKVRMGSSPVYGPCLLGLERRVHRTASECVDSFDAGLRNVNELKEMVAAFFILKTIKKTGADSEVHLSSLCIALCGERIAHKTEIREKVSSAPHRLFRYAIDGACVTVSGLCIASNDEDAREGLEVERRMREVKNQPPRSGNVKRFVDYTSKEIMHQKEKLSSASVSEKKTRDAQIERMEEMIKDARDLLASPEKTQPKGYSIGC